ncbi:MAG: 30S ribosomal protein S2, partial [Pseudomonadota bacterium]
QEAKKLGIPVVAVVDTNCDPDDINFPFPGNDDAARAIVLYCNLVADAVLDGLAESTAGLGIDLGEAEDVDAMAAADIAVADAAEAETPSDADTASDVEVAPDAEAAASAEAPSESETTS